MTTLSKLIAVVAVLAVQAQPAFAHVKQRSASMPPYALTPEKDVEGIKLPFDSVYCDLNDNSNIEKDEMTSDNLCFIEGGTTDLFAMKAIIALGLRKGQLLLTVDDGPNPKVTPQILTEVLAQQGAITPASLTKKVKAAGYIDEIMKGPGFVTVEGWALTNGELPYKLELFSGGRRVPLSPALRPRADLVTFLRESRHHLSAGFKFTMMGDDCDWFHPDIEVIAHHRGKSLRVRKQVHMISKQI